MAWLKKIFPRPPRTLCLWRELTSLQSKKNTSAGLPPLEGIFKKFALALVFLCKVSEVFLCKVIIHKNT